MRISKINLVGYLLLILAGIGALIQEAPADESQAVRTQPALDAKRPDDALATWFASAAPRLYRQADGRVWLDVLYTAQTPERHGSPHYVIYHRREVTDLLKANRERLDALARALLEHETLDEADAYAAAGIERALRARA